MGIRNSVRKLRIVMFASTLVVPLVTGTLLVENQAQAATSNVSTSFHGTCVGGQAGSVYCLPSRLTSNNVSNFEATVRNTTNNATCIYTENGVANLYTSGWYWTGTVWVQGSGGDVPFTNNHGVYQGPGPFVYGHNVPSGDWEQIVFSPVCSQLDLSATY